MLIDIGFGALGSFPRNFTTVGDRAFFTAANGASNGTIVNELWVTDGTAAGTRLVKDIDPGALGSSPDFFGDAGGNLVFDADDGTRGAELWRTDGTSGGTQIIRDINRVGGSDPNSFLALAKGTVIFEATGPNGAKLWRTDGTRPEPSRSPPSGRARRARARTASP